MSQSLANLRTHLIFSTKNREPLLATKDLQQSAHAYLAAVLKDRKCPAVIVGGIANHVHILCQLAKTESVSNLMEHLKASSSKEEHHRIITYEEEYRSFLKGYRVAFDERYVWD